jgi:glutathione synthase/RimK-type ligase-like ATP-grasp enzyme
MWLNPLQMRDGKEVLIIIASKLIRGTKSLFNRIPGLNLVSNKVYMGEIFKRLSKHYEYDFNFIPETFMLPSDETKLKVHSKNHKQPIYIVKPPLGCEGTGIFLVKGTKDIPSYTKDHNYIV